MSFLQLEKLFEEEIAKLEGSTGPFDRMNYRFYKKLLLRNTQAKLRHERLEERDRNTLEKARQYLIERGYPVSSSTE